MDEWKEGAKIAIALILLGVVVSLVFIILGFVRGTTNQGISMLENSMGAMQESQFEGYNQVLVSGTQTSAAITLFSGQQVAIIVRTLLQMSNSSNTGTNYGALLSTTSLGTFISAPITKIASNSWYTYDLLVTSGQYTYNMNTLATNTSGTSTFIRPTAKFLAELIKDSSGSTVGIVFTQQQ